MNLDGAIAHVEREVVTYLGKIQQKWLKLHPDLMWRHQMQLEHQVFEPLHEVLLDNAARHGCPWRFCEQVTLDAFTVLCKPGEQHSLLYLLHSGRVALFSSLPTALDHKHALQNSQKPGAKMPKTDTGQ